MNKVIFTGRMTKECEVRETPNGKLVTNFTLAVDRNYLNNEGKRDTDFFRINLWGSGAKAIANNGYKGCRLLIEGDLQNRNYVAMDGSKHYVSEIICKNFEFLSPKTNKNNELTNDTELQTDEFPDTNAELTE